MKREHTPTHLHDTADSSTSKDRDVLLICSIEFAGWSEGGEENEAPAGKFPRQVQAAVA